MECPINVGTSVMLSKEGLSKHPQNHNNPVGVSGMVLGLIKFKVSGTELVHVKWGNGRENYYRPSCLQEHSIDFTND